MSLLNLCGLLDAVGERLRDEPALLCGETTRSWQELGERTRRLASVLLDHDLGGMVRPPAEPWLSAQDHLAVVLTNGPEYLEGVVAAHRARVAPFNVNYRYTASEMAYVFRDAQPAAVLFHARFATQVAEAVESLARPPLLLQVADASGAELAPGALDYESAVSSASPELPATVTPAPDDLHILYTGGTTGMPKGVLWRVGDLVAGPLNVRTDTGRPCTTIDEALGRLTTKRQRALVCAPLMHGAGMWFALGAWCAGGTVVLQPHSDSLDFDALVETCARESVEAVLIVGDAFARPLIAALRASRAHLPALRVIVNAAASLREELKDELRALVPGVRVLDMLGASETGPLASRRMGMSFRPSPTLAVVSADRTRVLKAGDSEVGWLAQRGGIPRGYLGDASKTLQTFHEVEGVVHAIPGDRARLQSDGSFTLLGRDSMTINTGGEKVFAEEVEEILRGVVGVLDALVVGEPSARWGQQVVAVVELAPGVELSDEELLTAASSSLARYKLPKRVVRVPRVRRHANGKADYTWARSVLGFSEDSSRDRIAN